MQNQAFSYDAAPDLLIITCIDDNKLGQFIFLKIFFLKKNLENTKSKRQDGYEDLSDLGYPVSNQAKRAKCGSFSILLI